MVVGLTVLALVIPLPLLLTRSVWPQDEGLLLVYPAEMLRGALPNGTFTSTYGISTYGSIASVFHVVGPSVLAERILGLVYWTVLAVSLAVLVTRRRGSLAGAVAGLTCSVLLVAAVPLMASAWAGAAAMLALGLLVADISASYGQQPVIGLLAGAFMGVTITYRMEFFAAVVLFALGLLCQRQQRLAVWLGAGALIGLLPLAWQAANIGVGRILAEQLIQPVFVSGPGRRLPLTESSWQQQLTLLATVVIVVWLLITGVASVRLRSDDHTLALALALLALVPQALQRSDWVHVAYVASIVLPLAPLVRLPRTPVAVLGPATAAGAIAVAWPFIGGTYVGDLKAVLTRTVTPAVNVAHSGRSVPVATAADASALTRLLSTLDARAQKGERVFVGPHDLRRTNYNDTYLYFLMPDLVPGSRYLEMNPGVANGADSGLADDVARSHVLILTSRYDAATEPNASRDFGPDTPNEIVARDFVPLDQAGPWTLYVRR